MTEIQEAFLADLNAKAKHTVKEYAEIYNKHAKIAVEQELESGVSQKQAETMGHYYTVAILSRFIKSENILTRVLDLCDSKN